MVEMALYRTPASVSTALPHPLHICPPFHRSTENSERGFYPCYRRGFKGREEPIKAFSFILNRETGTEGLWTLEKPLASPVCTLHMKGDCPLASHCLWDTVLHHYGVFTSCYSLIYLPTPASPAYTCVC